MKKGIVILFAATIGLAACNSEKKGPGGLVYQIYKDAGKEKIKEGDFIKLNYIQKNERDSVIMNTFDTEQPGVFPVSKKMYSGDMNDVLTYFGEGDSATFKVNLDTLAKHSGQPKQPANTKDTYLVFTVKVEKVLKKLNGEADTTYQKRAQEFFQKDFMEVAAKKKTAEPAKIKAFIEDKKLKPQTTATGLQYVITNPGTGEKPVAGDTVLLNYTGKLLTKKSDGSERIFDTTNEKIAKDAKIFHPMAQYTPRPFSIGNAIPGFDQGYQLIGKGGKITVIIPSSLAYGEGGQPQAGITPYSPLSFDIEIVDIKKPKNAPVAAAPVAPAAPTAKVK